MARLIQSEKKEESLEDRFAKARNIDYMLRVTQEHEAQKLREIKRKPVSRRKL